MKNAILILIYNRLVGSRLIIPQARKIPSRVYTKPQGGLFAIMNTAADLTNPAFFDFALGFDLTFT